MTKIYVSNEDYYKLLNGKTLNILVDSIGEPMIEAKVIFKDAKKKSRSKSRSKSETTSWDNPPRFTSIEQRDLYYK